MEIIGIVLILTIVFWGVLRNLNKAGEIASRGILSASAKYAATSAKELTPEDIKVLEVMRDLHKL